MSQPAFQFPPQTAPGLVQQQTLRQQLLRMRAMALIAELRRIGKELHTLGNDSLSCEQKQIAGSETTAISQPGEDHQAILRPSDAAKILRVSPKHVIRMVQEGRLRGINVGRSKQKPRYRITREALESLLQEIERAPAEPSKKLRRQQGALPRPSVDYFPG
jgi:excisionase family DNA binding protein